MCQKQSCTVLCVLGYFCFFVSTTYCQRIILHIHSAHLTSIFFFTHWTEQTNRMTEFSFRLGVNRPLGAIPHRHTSSPSMASCSSVLAKDTLPPMTAPMIYTSHVKRPGQHIRNVSIVMIQYIDLYIRFCFKLTLLHRYVHCAGVGGLQQLLVRLGRLIEELDQQGAGLLIFAPPDSRQLVQLLLHQASIVQGVFKTIPA